MTDTPTEATAKVTKPTHRVYAVTKRANAEKADWAEIGAAWANRDGKGFNLKLNLLPVNGADIVVRLIEPDKKTAQPAEPPSEQPSRSAITASPVDHAYGPPDQPDPRVRDGADIVAGIGLGMAGGAATLVERLFDGFLGGAPARPAPAPEQDNRPDPSTTQRFRTAAAEARQQAEREQEAQARDDWWDERRSRARD